MENSNGVEISDDEFFVLFIFDVLVVDLENKRKDLKNQDNFCLEIKQQINNKNKQ